MNRYHGRRFASFLVATGALIGGFFFGNPMMFGAYATSLGVLYGAYLAGQSATDWQKAKNGG
jgi:hypothetical protein